MTAAEGDVRSHFSSESLSSNGLHWRFRESVFSSFPPPLPVPFATSPPLSDHKMLELCHLGPSPLLNLLALTRQFIQLRGLKYHPQALDLYFLSWSLLGALDSYTTAYLRLLLGSEAGVPATLAKEPILPTVSLTSTQATTMLLKLWLIHLPSSPHPTHQ